MRLFEEPDIPAPESAETPDDLSGFERFHPLLRVLIAQDVPTFYERLRVLLTLARWRGDPPTVQALSRALPGSNTNGLGANLARLRSAGWLISGQDDQRYVLAPHGRILLVLLQLLAQPWVEGDVTAVAAQIYQAGEGLELRRDLLTAQFEGLLSTLEERVGQIEAAQKAEDTAQVADRLAESRRNVRIAHKALDLRQKGATTPDDYQQVQRMHTAISRLSAASPRLEARYKKLLMRDLLAQGLVTLGDIMAWAREADLNELSAAILPFMKLPFLPLWAASEAAVLDAGIELTGKSARQRRSRPPEPAPLSTLPAGAELDEIKQLVYRKQEELRVWLQAQDPISLSEWISQPEWSLAVTHLAAALDPKIQENETPVFLHLQPEGQLEQVDSEIIDRVTIGQLTRLLQAPLAPLIPVEVEHLHE